MFTKPVQDLEFSDVESFCKTYVEGIRVEYKESIPKKKLPKTISAFANTLGGTLILGAKTDENNRAILPIEGMKKQRGIEETITASSLQGIYPAIFPEVKVIDVPDKSDRIVVVVKVHESVEAPHAVCDSTRVYIRTGSLSHPYKLAEINRIEYMLKRRQKPEERKQRIMSAAENRYTLHLKAQQQSTGWPTLQLTVSVAFPYQPVISLEQLDQFVGNIPPGNPVRFLHDYVKRVHEGICYSLPCGYHFEYLEINHYGVFFSKGGMRKVDANWKVGPPEEVPLYVDFPALVTKTGKVLRLAEIFYSQYGYLGNVEVRFTVNNVLKEKLIFTHPDEIGDEATDNQISAFQTFLVDKIKIDLTTIVTNLMKSALWIFNYDTASLGALQERVRKTLSTNRLIDKN